MDTKSLLTVDVEASISKAYDASLPAKVQEQICAHLAYILRKLKEPNSLIEPVRAALVVMQGRALKKQWHDNPVVRSVGAILLALLIAGLTKLLGWN